MPDLSEAAVSFWRVETLLTHRVHAVTAPSEEQAVEQLHKQGITGPYLVQLLKDYRPPDQHTFVVVEVVE